MTDDEKLEFDEKAVIEHFDKAPGIDKLDKDWLGQARDFACAVARWQHAQLAPVIGALKADNERLAKLYLEMRDGHEHVVHVMHKENDELRSKLAKAKEANAEAGRLMEKGQRLLEEKAGLLRKKDEAIRFALIYDPFVDQYKIKHTAWPKLKEALEAR